ncbi:MAG: phosphate acyltransferase, partial [Elusimicrobiota bacterium]
MKIALDAMGGDFCPQAEVAGVAQTIKGVGSTPEIVLVGDEQIIRAEIKKYGDLFNKIEIVHASQRVFMDDSPAKALKTKPNSSLLKSVRLCAEGKVDGVISAG